MELPLAPLAHLLSTGRWGQAPQSLEQRRGRIEMRRRGKEDIKFRLSCPETTQTFQSQASFTQTRGRYP